MMLQELERIVKKMYYLYFAGYIYGGSMVEKKLRPRRGPKINTEQKALREVWLKRMLEYYSYEESLKRAIGTIRQDEKLRKVCKINTDKRAKAYYKRACKDYRKLFSLIELIHSTHTVAFSCADKEKRKIQRRFDEIGIRDFINDLLTPNNNKIYKTSDWRTINYLRRHRKSDVLKLGYMNRIYSWSIVSELLSKLDYRFNGKEYDKDEGERVNIDEALKRVWESYLLGSMPQDTFLIEDYARMRDAMDRDIVLLIRKNEEQVEVQRLFQEFCDNTDMKFSATIKTKLNDLAKDLHKALIRKEDSSLENDGRSVQALEEFKLQYKGKALSDVTDIQLTFEYYDYCVNNHHFSKIPMELVEKIVIYESDIIDTILDKYCNEKRVKMSEQQRKHLRLRSSIILKEVEDRLRRNKT